MKRSKKRWGTRGKKRRRERKTIRRKRKWERN